MKPPRKKILIIEEDNDYRFLLHEFLEQTGFLIIEANRVSDAAKQALRERPDLIFIDLDFSEISGLRMIEQIWRHGELIETPILASSAFGTLAIELFLNIDDFGSGRIEYIPKPYSLSGLAQQIDLIVRGRRKTPSL